MKQIFDKFVALLQSEDTDQELVTFLGEIIEKALNSYLDSTKTPEEYKRQALNLVFNLKKNDVCYIYFLSFLSYHHSIYIYVYNNVQILRNDLIGGVVQPAELVRMTAKQLAPAHIAEERRLKREQLMGSKRTDLYDIARQQIQLENNLSQDTEFTCKRCKSTRTTHYAMQTRSSDEPMTIFVCCLDCKFRWRC